MIPENLKPLSLEEAERISDSGERLFATAVAGISHLLIFHEPHTFRACGKGRTVPDFLVVNTHLPDNLQNGVYVEVTKGRSGHPRKKKQLAIMRRHPVKYTQLDYHHLDNISMAQDMSNNQNNHLLSQTNSEA